MSKTGKTHSNVPAVYTIEWQTRLLGMPLSEHPMQRIGPYLERTQGILPLRDLPTTQPKQEIIVCGIVKEVTPTKTRKGQPMMYVILEDHTAEVKVTIFQYALKFTASVFIKGALVKVRGKANHRVNQQRKKETPKRDNGSEDGIEQEVEEEEVMAVNYEVLVDGAELVVLE